MVHKMQSQSTNEYNYSSLYIAFSIYVQFLGLVKLGNYNIQSYLHKNCKKSTGA